MGKKIESIAGIFTPRKGCKLKIKKNLKIFQNSIQKSFLFRVKRVSGDIKRSFNEFKRTPKSFEYKGNSVEYEVFYPKKRSTKSPVFFFGGLKSPSIKYTLRLKQLLAQGRKVIFFNSNTTWNKSIPKTLIHTNFRDKNTGISKYYNIRIQEAIMVYRKELSRKRKILIVAHSQGAIHAIGFISKLLKKKRSKRIKRFNVILEAPAGLDHQDLFDVPKIMGRAMNTALQEGINLPKLERYLFFATKRLGKKFTNHDSLKSASGAADTNMTPAIKKLLQKKKIKLRIFLPTSDRLLKGKETLRALSEGKVNTSKIIKSYPCNKYGHNAISYDRSSVVLDMIKKLERRK